MIPGGLEVLLFAKRADGSHELTGGNRVYRDKSLPPDYGFTGSAFQTLMSSK